MVFHLSKDFSPTYMSFIYDEIFIRKIYEFGKCRIELGDWVIDAGACEGFFSLYVLSKGANVMVFEPVPQLFKALEKTLDPYIKAGRAKVFQLAWMMKSRKKESSLIKTFRPKLALVIITQKMILKFSRSSSKISTLVIKWRSTTKRSLLGKSESEMRT